MNKCNIKKTILIAIVICFSVGISSCTTGISLNPKAGQVIKKKDWTEIRHLYTYKTGEILIETDLYEEKIRQNARNNLSLLLEELNESIQTVEKRVATVQLSLREYSFMKDFKPLKSISVNMVILDEKKESLGSYYFCTETKDTLFSSTYLYKQLDRGLRKFF